jgi:hypothetical protein
MKEQIYHLLIKKECNHKCPLCCNRLYDLGKLPTITVEQLQTADVVCLTGGEPFMITPNDLIWFCRNLRAQFPNIQKIYIYTSGFALLRWTMIQWFALLYYIDGLNISPKSQREWDALREMILTDSWYSAISNPRFSNRIYVFDDQWQRWEGISKDLKLPSNWNVIGRKWDAEFKTPENEHFVRLPILY